ncbi:hypothetical protein CCO03_02745 [Comamonas serinivorans]|uniref:DUF4230 domain-containing protein n=1 Tax=Comamonas serinivorans TaxID=1082851 RepID=A0A1Y0EJJ2_9BURK|nr:hypothetical protein [Comamonas serinivorans]ARU03747.1 hypothetical protein CCO03_02745 [Comamonas serinivorans]
MSVTPSPAAASPAPVPPRRSAWPWALAAGLALAGTLAGLVGGAWWAVQHMPARTEQVATQVSTPEVPLVLRTSGGLLEVASIRATERFSRRDTQSFWGIHLGETVTEVTVPAVYRYQLPLARQWPVQLEGGVVTVDAPAFAPSLPVAMDTTQMQTWGRNGWARFNQAESLAALQRSLSPQLAERAQSPHYRELATEAARRTVAEYVRTWLTTSGRGPVHEVRVRFPGEAQATAPVAAPAPPAGLD